MDIHISLAAEELFKVGPVPVTNSMLTMFLVMIVVLGAGIFIARRLQPVPGRAQGIAEMLVGFIVDLVDGAGGRRVGRRVLPFVMGLFIFILFSNFSGLLPGVGTIGIYEEHAVEEEEHSETGAATTGEATTTTDDAEHEDAAATTDEAVHAEEEEHEKVLVPFFRPPTADLNMTFALSILAFTAIQIAGVKAHGVVGRIKHMADPPFLFPIEVIGELSRILSLSARLFGNVFAGEILLGVMYAIGAAIKIAIVPWIFPVVFLGLEVLFGTIQALVFALLTLIYIMLAAAHSEHDEGHGHDDHAAHAPTPATQPSGD
jgi:F-type H+-transporting ATPase subunit a